MSTVTSFDDNKSDYSIAILHAYQEIACTNRLFVSVSHIEVQTSVRH